MTHETLKPKYTQYTQTQFWRFSRQELLELRQRTNDEVSQRVWESHRLEKELETCSPVSLDEIKTSVQCLTVEEEQLLISHYELQIPKICRVLKLGDVVNVTASTYFRRFFLRNSVMEYDPKIIMLACTYLATKTTHNVISLSDYVKKIKNNMTEKIIKDMELKVCEEVGWHFWVREPTGGVFGVYLDVQTYDMAVSKETLFATYQASLKLVSKALRSDLMFLHQPSQIGLACFWLAAEKERWDLSKYITDKFTSSPHLSNPPPPSSSNDEDIPMLASFDLLLTLLMDIKFEVQNLKPLDQEGARAADSKLQGCRNLELVPETKVYAGRLAQEQADQEARRQAKVRAMHSRMAAETRDEARRDMNAPTLMDGTGGGGVLHADGSVFG